MGHSSSKEQPLLQPQGRHTHRLSKPRVTSSISPPSSQPTAPTATRSPEPAPDLLISIPYSATSSSSVESPEDDRNESRPIPDRSSSRSPSKPQRRLSLFRSKSFRERPTLHNTRRNTIIGAPSTIPEQVFVEALGAVGRTHSLSTHRPTHQLDGKSGMMFVLAHPITIAANPTNMNSSHSPASNRPTSWAYGLSSSEAQSIRLVQDSIAQPNCKQTLSPAGETRINEMHHTATWRRHSSIAAQPESAPISRTNSEISLHPPMRRRSMIQTPGVATRPRPGPVPSRSTKSSIRHSHPPSPNMSRQTSIEAMDSILSSNPMPAAFWGTGDIQRVRTPNDSDYCATGAFKFGTLRITNGSPVQTQAPTENRETDSKANEAHPPNGHVTAAPAAETEVSGRTTQVIGPASTQQSIVTKSENVVEAGKAPRISVAIPTLDLGIHSAFELLAIPNERPEEHLPSSPLKTQSKNAAVDDDLFGTDEDEESEIRAVEVLDVRLDLNAKGLPPQPIDETVVVPSGVKRTDSGFVSSSNSKSSQSRSSLAKADSGYSSNVSLRSLHSGRKSLRAENDIERSSVESDSDSSRIHRVVSPKRLEIKVPELADGGNTIGATETPQSDKAPTPPPKDSPSSSAAPMSPGKLRKKPSQVRSPVSEISQTGDCEATKASASNSSSMAASNDSKSSLSIGNSAQKPGRLSRLLSLKGSPFSKQSYTVHITHAVDGQIPSIPKEVEDKLREHTGLFPMTTKRLALRSQLSKETLKTILSVGSLEMAKDDELPRTPTFFDKEEGETKPETDANDANERSLKNSFTSVQSNLKIAAASMMPSRSSITRKPVPVRTEPRKVSATTATTKIDKEEDTMLPAEVALTSYCSVNSSLGNNAYDVAAKAITIPARPARSLSVTAPRAHPPQFRTFSLHDSTQPSVGSLASSGQQLRPTSPTVVDDLQRRKSPPPVSLVTRAGFRAPPPRAPFRPQGPVVQREDDRPNITGATGTTPRTPSSDRLVHHRASVDSLQSRVRATPTLQQSVHPFRHNSLNSHEPASASNRFKSPSSTPSVHSDIVRGTHNLQAQMNRQTHHASMPKHMENYERVQPHGVYMPQPAHQGPPAPWQYMPQTQQWNSQNHGCVIDNRASWNQASPSIPYVPRDNHRRNLSAGSRPYYQMNGGQPPYRILHSYNSPAYRNAPIWG